MNDERLDLDQDLKFQRREWRVQRVGWLLWAVLILAALAGLVGPGPLSSNTAATSDGRLVLKYNRFVHRHHQTEFELTMQPESEQDESIRLRLSQPLLQRIQISRIEPEPASSQLTADGVWYEFNCKPGSKSLQAVFRLEHDKIGRGTCQLQLADDQPLNASFFVYP
jgi:hypothetical protein